MLSYKQHSTSSEEQPVDAVILEGKEIGTVEPSGGRFLAFLDLGNLNAVCGWGDSREEAVIAAIRRGRREADEMIRVLSGYDALLAYYREEAADQPEHDEAFEGSRRP